MKRVAQVFTTCAILVLRLKERNTMTTTPAIEKIMAELDTAFAGMDAKVLENSQAWAKARCAGLKEFMGSDEHQAVKRLGVWQLYRKLHSIAGGKTWYNIFRSGYNDFVEVFVTKNCRAVAKRRNAGIAKKLIKAGVTSVQDTKFTWSADGFNGFFRVGTDKGDKVVKIQSIYAGGYNIQCLHLRVLVTVK